jgi:hypothetical protein
MNPPLPHQRRLSACSIVSAQSSGAARVMRCLPAESGRSAISGLVIARQDRHRRTIIAVFGISIQIELCSIADRHAA